MGKEEKSESNVDENFKYIVEEIVEKGTFWIDVRLPNEANVIERDTLVFAIETIDGLPAIPEEDYIHLPEKMEESEVTTETVTQSEASSETVTQSETSSETVTTEVVTSESTEPVESTTETVTYVTEESTTPMETTEIITYEEEEYSVPQTITTTTTTYIEEPPVNDVVPDHQCQHMQTFLKEIRECNESLERSIQHLNTMPNDESLKMFIIGKQQELRDFNAENCMNIQILVREMMKSNETLIHKFNESIQYMMGEMSSKKTASCGQVVGYVTTEEFIPAEMRVTHANNTQTLMRQMKDSNDTLIQQCEQCVPQPCHDSYNVVETSVTQVAPPPPPPPVTQIVSHNVPEQIITHEERMKMRLHRQSTDEDFVFQKFKDPCSKVSFYLMHG